MAAFPIRKQPRFVRDPSAADYQRFSARGRDQVSERVENVVNSSEGGFRTVSSLQEVVDHFRSLALQEGVAKATPTVEWDTEEVLASGFLLEPENIAFRERLAVLLSEERLALNNEQLTWLRTEFQLLESVHPAAPCPLQDYLHASAFFPAVTRPKQTFGSFDFLSAPNKTAINISLRLLEDQNIKPEEFVDYVTAFIKTSEASVNISRRGQVLYPYKSLEVKYIVKEVHVQLQLGLNVALGLQLSLSRN